MHDDLRSEIERFLEWLKGDRTEEEESDYAKAIALKILNTAARGQMSLSGGTGLYYFLIPEEWRFSRDLDFEVDKRRVRSVRNFAESIVTSANDVLKRLSLYREIVIGDATITVLGFVLKESRGITARMAFQFPSPRGRDLSTFVPRSERKRPDLAGALITLKREVGRIKEIEVSITSTTIIRSEEVESKKLPLSVRVLCNSLEDHLFNKLMAVYRGAVIEGIIREEEKVPLGASGRRRVHGRDIYDLYAILRRGQLNPQAVRAKCWREGVSYPHLLLSVVWALERIKMRHDLLRDVEWRVPPERRPTDLSSMCDYIANRLRLLLPLRFYILSKYAVTTGELLTLAPKSTVYYTLARLKKEGLLEEVVDERDERRRIWIVKFRPYPEKRHSEIDA